MIYLKYNLVYIYLFSAAFRTLCKEGIATLFLCGTAVRVPKMKRTCRASYALSYRTYCWVPCEFGLVERITQCLMELIVGCLVSSVL